MTTYAYPDTAPFRPQSFVAGLKSSVLVSTSPLNGSVQTVELLGDRWTFALDYAPHTLADQSALEGFWNRIRGRANRVQIWHMGRAAPRGTMRGSPTLSGSHARGALTLSITTTAGATLLAGDLIGINSQIVQAAADATADGAGTMTLQIVAPLRAAASNGTAVSWDKPTALFMVNNDQVRVPYGVGQVHPGFSVDLIEAWA